MDPSSPLPDRYRAVRARSLRLAASLSAEDQQIQAYPYASPTKWHLAHTTWFFETFVLLRYAPERAPRRAGYEVLFNSYYEGVGERFSRPHRGLLSRPSLADVHSYREAVDAGVLAVLEQRDDPELQALCTLGLAHEEQHQELLLTDILANLSINPLRPAWRDEPLPPSHPAPAPGWVSHPGGLVEVGTDRDGFHFDNEGPAHPVHLAPFALRDAPVTNAEVLAFIEDGGYRTPALWLSDGIAWVRENNVQAPRYWRRADDGAWRAFTLYGEVEVDRHAPATHLSAYEADAIATWLGCRLPTEHEWEAVAQSAGGPPSAGRWVEDGPVRPQQSGPGPGGLYGLWGETWEWTRSAYAPYPGYRPAAGAVGEYNSKFMANQWVLRGGSCATSPGHTRATYRNFFYLHERWQFTGLRPARDA